MLRRVRNIDIYELVKQRIEVFRRIAGLSESAIKKCASAIADQFDDRFQGHCRAISPRQYCVQCRDEIRRRVDERAIKVE